ncbi:TrbI/VirB10 family protein [Halobacteriovorax sp. HLS]|uniref:TrbI/VirB10 family protein n=1 Tax=Halobacteriovorax sp. HLS TaxID=2234000 RepID=UPI000FDC4F19|nr:TrbI/VirB10 family protein [Halobacteriovorax sp. HLS]
MFGKVENTAIVKKVDKSLINTDRFQEAEQIVTGSKKIGGGIKAGDQSRSKVKTRSIKRMPNIKLMAKQIISRSDLATYQDAIPTGTNFIGKLISRIDTREQNQFIKVLLPYGGSFKGRSKLPNDTILLGTAKYSGHGKKVFVQFAKAILPTGMEVEINAQALNPDDYSSGILGDYHGTAGVRIATTLGLSMVSGMTEVLTEKKALGESGAVTPKATMKNALYHGVSKVTDMEAARQAQELSAEKPYVTIDAGVDLIISLMAPLNMKKGDL